MRAPILDQPLIAVADSHEEKVDRYHRDDRAIWTGGLAHGKERVGDRDIGFDEANPVRTFSPLSVETGKKSYFRQRR
jgi:hypothetical protein